MYFTNQYMMNRYNPIYKNYQTNLVKVFFRSSCNQLYEVTCEQNEKIFKLIERYKDESGDYVAQKFLYNSKYLNPHLTLAEAGIIDGSCISVSNPGEIKGGGSIISSMTFTDLSQNKTKEIGFSPYAPSYRRVTRGINIFGICHCKYCKAYEKEVAVNIYNREFNLIKERDSLFCPECQSPITPKTVGFYLCRYQISGKKVENNRIEKFMNPIDEATNSNSVKYFDPDSNGEVMMIELKIEVLEYL